MPAVAVAGLPIVPVGQGGQAVDAVAGQKHDAAAVAAVAAVGPAAGNVFLAAEADAPVTPFARLDPNFNFVDECWFHKCVFRYLSYQAAYDMQGCR